MEILVGLFALSTVVLAKVVWRLHSALRAKEDRLDYTESECERLQNHITKIARHVEEHNGGALFRIKECRETTEAIIQYAPDLFKNATGLVHWLSATDQFLRELDRITIEAAPTNRSETRALLSELCGPTTLYDRIKFGPPLSGLAS